MSFVINAYTSLGILIAIFFLIASICVERPYTYTFFPYIFLVMVFFRVLIGSFIVLVIVVGGDKGITAAGKFIAIIIAPLVETATEVLVYMLAAIIALTALNLIRNMLIDAIELHAATFTLETAPNMEMAIRADIMAGIIGNREAERRGRAIEGMLDFHAMIDSAVKFELAGTPIALCIIANGVAIRVAINVAVYGMIVSDAIRAYAVPAIGICLICRISALLMIIGCRILIGRLLLEEKPLGI